LDVTQALKDAENSLRDFINNVLQQKFGNNWVEKSGVSPARIKEWQERKLVEEKRQVGGAVEERLIYYADFYDLKTILKKHWSGVFSEVFGEFKTMEVRLIELEKLRDPDAHRRELLPHQKHLALGISGEIRTRLVRYRSKQETSEDYFPRIESVLDNFGNIWTPGINRLRTLNTSTLLRPNDLVEYVVTATDPLGDELDFGLGLSTSTFDIHWQKSNVLSFTVLEEHVRRGFIVTINIRSSREYHAGIGFDERIEVAYDIIPQRMRSHHLRMEQI